jgi:uncharacterized protein with PIN domain
VKFIVDEMCGDINRWLRMLGYDSTSPQDHPNHDGSTPNDDKIVEICISTNRILISKDYEIIKKMHEKTDKELKTDTLFVSRFEISHNGKKNRKKQMYPCLLLHSTDIAENLSKIHKYFKIRLEYDIYNARCPKCNTKIQKINNPDNYKNRIPPSVFEYHSDFWECSNPKCGQIFWKGTHIERIIRTLNSIQKIK